MARRLIAVVLLAAACAEAAPPTLEIGSLEAALAEAVWPDDPGLIADVDCPEVDIELIAQATTCTAVLDADRVTVDVDIDELGAATATVRESLFVVAEAADELVSRLRDDLSIEAIQASCADTVIVAESGRTLACEATSGERTIPFELVLGDDDGSWNLRLAN